VKPKSGRQLAHSPRFQRMQDVALQMDDSDFPTLERVRRSPLATNGGYIVLPGWMSKYRLKILAAEANALRATGKRYLVVNSDGTEGRGGSPARAFRSAGGGDIHWRIHSSSRVTDALGRLCNTPVEPTGAGIYTYYEQAGDFLGLHRDEVECDIAVITSLTRNDMGGSAGGLHVYPRHIGQPLSKVRAAGRLWGVPVPLGHGDTAVLLGGILPHEVTPLLKGQKRIVAINCYRIRAGSSHSSAS
jgi:hypothetical protein